MDTILRSDKQPPGRNSQMERLLLWYDRKFLIYNPHHKFYKDQDQDEDIDTFIKNFYDPDDIIKVDDDV